MNWTDIAQQAARADMARTLNRMAEIMEHPAVTEQLGLAYTTKDTDRINSARDALKGMTKPETFAGRLMNETAMGTVEKGLITSVIILNRNGFQDVKGIAWEEADQRQAEATLKEYERLTQHQRN